MSLAAVSYRDLGERLMDGLAAKFVEPQKAWRRSAP
jgi:hypothetical protein